MIITRLKIDNLYGFQNFELDLTYPRKHSQSFIDYEFLEEVPKFKFKRVCILMGTNASGKTSLGKVLWGIQAILNKANLLQIPTHLLDAVCDKQKNAIITMEFVSPHYKTFHYLMLEFQYDGTLIDAQFTYIDLKETDTNQIAHKRLQKSLNQNNGDLNEIMLSFSEYFKDRTTGFYYIFAGNHTNDFSIQHNSFLQDNLEKLLSILNTFDSSIKDISPLKTLKNNGEIIFEGYTVFFENGDSVKVTDNGETFTAKDKNRFSKGTYDVLGIADFIFAILNNGNNTFTYFLDEKLASSHSELEMTILNLIIQKLKKYSQFFYTTHNYDILDLNLPAHSFVFLNKENGYCQAEQPEKLGFSKNDRKLKGYVRNNYFRTIPSTHLLDELMWGEDDE